MFTRKALDSQIKAFLSALEEKGFHVSKVILFGSYDVNVQGSENRR